MSLGERGAVIDTPKRQLAKKTAAIIEIDTRSRQLQFTSPQTGAIMFAIAVGKPSTTTPGGSWKVRTKQMNPGGVLGSRWMGLNIPTGNYGIHGTNAPWSIGRAASNGCIRMHNHDVERIYPLCPVGTPVYINLGFGYRSDHRPVQPDRDGNNDWQEWSDSSWEQPNWDQSQSSYHPTLRRGNRGMKVSMLQQRLQVLGHYRGRIDGIYGPLTEQAVRQYQVTAGLSPTGVADSQTQMKLGM